VAAIARIPGVRQIPQALGPVLEDTILFDSWRGQYSDNPRAIAEELHRREAGLRQVWVLDPALAEEVPDWIEPVAPGSARHLAMMARARYLVANATVPGFHLKRRGTFFLQTWHGTPLKRIGFDIPREAARAPRTARATLAHNVKRWDLLLSPNPFSTPIFRKSFAFPGRIEETGYPRNDLLQSPDADDIRDRTRAGLGIAGHQRVVLYAPTFRDAARFTLLPEVQRLAGVLGEAYVVLMRAHKLDAADLPGDPQMDLLDVSSYPDNRELFLAADILVTDYSSVMFDFAVTGKPMLFWTHDLAEYRDSDRGFSFDFEAQAPGPLLGTADEVAAAITDLENVSARYSGAYLRFRERFCALEDGRASARVVDLLLD
jgi:CDP-glycerol glycerophosphotransferase